MLALLLYIGRIVWRQPSAVTLPARQCYAASPGAAPGNLGLFQHLSALSWCFSWSTRATGERPGTAFPSNFVHAQAFRLRQVQALSLRNTWSMAVQRSL
jgi:hypothetical protein